MVPVVFNTMLLINPVKAFADEDTGKVCLDFFFNKSDSVFNPDDARNHRSVDSLHSLLKKDFLFKDVTVAGFTSPEGDGDYNGRLARARAYSLYNYVLQFPALTNGNVTILPGKVDWRGLSHLTDDEIMNLEERVYPRLRRAELSFRCLNSLDISDSETTDSCQHTKDVESLYLTDSQQITPPLNWAAENSGHDSYLTDSYKVGSAAGGFVFGFKTNLLYDVALVPNISVEFHLAKNWSISAGGHYAWWSKDSRHRFERTYGGELEVRHYFNRRRLTGHHLGFYGQGLTYDLEWGHKGYISDFSYGGGISYGYSLATSRRLHIDFALGLGYLGGTYETYEPHDGHYVWQETRNRHWWGPTKLEVSLVWLIGRGSGGKEGNL